MTYFWQFRYSIGLNVFRVASGWTFYARLSKTVAESFETLHAHNSGRLLVWRWICFERFLVKIWFLPGIGNRLWRAYFFLWFPMFYTSKFPIFTVCLHNRRNVQLFSPSPPYDSGNASATSGGPNSPQSASDTEEITQKDSSHSPEDKVCIFCDCEYISRLRSAHTEALFFITYIMTCSIRR